VFDPMHTRGFDVIRWSIKGGASIPHCTSGTIWQVRLKRHPGDSDVIRWSIKCGASIPHCTSGTIFRSRKHSTRESRHNIRCRLPSSKLFV